MTTQHSVSNCTLDSHISKTGDPVATVCIQKTPVAELTNKRFREILQKFYLCDMISEQSTGMPAYLPPELEHCVAAVFVLS